MWIGKVVRVNGSEIMVSRPGSDICEIFTREPENGPNLDWMLGGNIQTAGKRVLWNEITVGHRIGYFSFKLRAAADAEPEGGGDG